MLTLPAFHRAGYLLSVKECSLLQRRPCARSNQVLAESKSFRAAMNLVLLFRSPGIVSPAVPPSTEQGRLLSRFMTCNVQQQAR